MKSKANISPCNHYSGLLARCYDAILYPFLHRVRQEVVKTAQHLKAYKVLDLCCGTGNQLAYLQAAGFNKLVGIDASEQMLRQAQRNKVGKLCRKGDASNTGLDDKQFDLVILSLIIHETQPETARNILNEATRLLKPQGHLLLVDYCLNQHTNPIGKLAIRFIERCAGGNHYKNFKHYIRTGGMQQYTRNYQNSSESRFALGALRLYVFKAGPMPTPKASEALGQTKQTRQLPKQD